MGRDSHEIWPKVTIKPKKTFSPGNLGEAIYRPSIPGQALCRPTHGLILKPRLDEIKRQADGRPGETCNESRKSRLLRDRKGRILAYLVLGLGEKCQLAKVRRHGSNDGRR